jgi:hypothetical protein
VEALMAMSLMLVISSGLLTALVASTARTEFLKTDSAAYDHASILYERLMAIPFGSAVNSSPTSTALISLIALENTTGNGGATYTQIYNGTNLNLRQVRMAAPLTWRYVLPAGGTSGGNNLSAAEEAVNPTAGLWEIRVSDDLNGPGPNESPVNQIFQSNGDVLRVEIVRNGRVLKHGLRSRTPQE